MVDCLIVGAGIIGLSLAWELAQRGRIVQVIDRGEPGKEASWAGAGMLPPAKRQRALHPLDQLHAISHELHPHWAQKLFAETGIDNGYRPCGAIYVARSAGEVASLTAAVESWREDGIVVEPIFVDDLAAFEPALAASSTDASIRSCFLLPEESQLRNPRHMKALYAACLRWGVEITSAEEALAFDIHAGSVVAVRTTRRVWSAKQTCLCSGAWTGALLQQLGISNGIDPVRGQIVLFHCERPLLNRIVIEGQRYLVPRDDGRILAGSTMEEVGFDKRTTEDGVNALIRFARQLAPLLCEAEIERAWAGLRPGTFDGMPYLGRIPGLSNAFVAAGHFRNGIQLAPATAVEMAKLMCGEPNDVDLTPFHVGRRRDFN